MSTLIIDNKTLHLSQQGQSIKIKALEQASKTIPFRQLDKLVISSDVSIQTRLLRNLAQNGIGILIINPRKPEQYAQLHGTRHNDAARRIRQMHSSENPQHCQDIARYLVRQKIKGQRDLLRKQRKKRAQYRLALGKATSQLKQIQQRIKQQPQLAIDQLRGMEGASAAIYFKAYGLLFAKELQFNGRNRRPPKDPVNAVLSLSYTLADSLAGFQAQVAGLDPMIGFYHKLSWSRHSLSSDLIEPLRPEIDAWVLKLFNRKILRVENFSQHNAACYLNKQGRAQYYKIWETRMKKTAQLSIEKTLKQLNRLQQKAVTSDD